MLVYAIGKLTIKKITMTKKEQKKQALKEYHGIVVPARKKYKAIIEQEWKKYRAKCTAINAQYENTKILK